MAFVRMQRRLLLLVCAACASVAIGACFLSAEVSSGGSAADVREGARLYRAYCMSCHGDRDGVGRVPGVPSHGPSGHTWTHRDEVLVERLRNGGAAVPNLDVRMPSFADKLSIEQMAMIVAFLKTWWTPEENEMRNGWYGCRESVTPSC
jgi:mono/diheme cytochrome c family protein